jgi:hypothetical protein
MRGYRSAGYLPNFWLQPRPRLFRASASPPSPPPDQRDRTGSKESDVHLKITQMRAQIRCGVKLKCSSYEQTGPKWSRTASSNPVCGRSEDRASSTRFTALICVHLCQSADALGCVLTFLPVLTLPVTRSTQMHTFVPLLSVRPVRVRQLFVVLVLLACTYLRSDRMKPAWSVHLKGWRKIFGLFAFIAALLIVMNPEFLALGVLGDTALFDVLVVALGLQMHLFVTGVLQRCGNLLWRGVRWVGIPSPGLRYGLAILMPVVAGAVAICQRTMHRILS